VFLFGVTSQVTVFGAVTIKFFPWGEAIRELYWHFQYTEFKKVFQLAI
jgi:hypothetical protein